MDSYVRRASASLIIARAMVASAWPPRPNPRWYCNGALKWIVRSTGAPPAQAGCKNMFAGLLLEVLQLNFTFRDTAAADKALRLPSGVHTCKVYADIPYRFCSQNCVQTRIGRQWWRLGALRLMLQRASWNDQIKEIAEFVIIWLCNHSFSRRKVRDNNSSDCRVFRNIGFVALICAILRFSRRRLRSSIRFAWSTAVSRRILNPLKILQTEMISYTKQSTVRHRKRANGIGLQH